MAIPKGMGMAMGMAIGICAGIAIGLAMGSLPIGIALGSGIGISIGTAFEGTRPLTKDNEERRVALRVCIAALLILGVILSALVITVL